MNFGNKKMRTVSTGTMASLANGQQEFGPFSVRDNEKYFRLRLGRCTSLNPFIWPSKDTTLRIEFFVSIDGGEFVSTAEHRDEGGIITLKDGTELAETIVIFDPPPGVNRKVKATVTVTNGPLQTPATFEAI
jgi:hypothetical protein